MHPHLMHIISFLVTPPQDHHITMVVGMALRSGERLLSFSKPCASFRKTYSATEEARRAFAETYSSFEKTYDF